MTHLHSPYLCCVATPGVLIKSSQTYNFPYKNASAGIDAFELRLRPSCPCIGFYDPTFGRPVYRLTTLLF
jgi:hypothetical protein